MLAWNFFLKNIGKCWFSETKSFYRHILSFTCIWLEMFSGLRSESGWQENTNLSPGVTHWPRPQRRCEWGGAEPPAPAPACPQEVDPPSVPGVVPFPTLLALHKEAVLRTSFIKTILKSDFWFVCCFFFNIKSNSETLKYQREQIQIFCKLTLNPHIWFWFHCIFKLLHWKESYSISTSLPTSRWVCCFFLSIPPFVFFSYFWLVP